MDKEEYEAISQVYSKHACEEILSLLEERSLSTNNESVYKEALHYLDSKGIKYSLGAPRLFKYEIKLLREDK